MTSWESLMSNRNFRQSVVALALVALLGAPLISSASPRRAGLLGEQWSVSSGLFTWVWGFLGGVSSKNGCRIDPNGGYVTSSLENSDNGCMIDPSGQLVTSSEATPKEGCRIDPNGRCI